MYTGRSETTVRTDQTANLAMPAEMMTRFFETYPGPLAPATVLGRRHG